MSYSPLLLSVFLGFSLAACTEATFAGANPGRVLASPTGTQSSTATDVASQAGPSADLPQAGSEQGPESAEPQSTEPSVATSTTTAPSTVETVSTATSPTISSDPATEPPVCQDQTRSIGAQIAFLIDNSQSNEATDCPFPVATGSKNSNGGKLYRCELATNREKAVLAAFDFLQELAAKESDNTSAVSSVAVASFPATEFDGYKLQSEWRSAVLDQRSAVAQVMRFTREPAGQTPYGEALAGAQAVFSRAAADNRGKMAILITDGLPTDRNPSAVQAKADALRQSGVKVVTVYVTGSAQRQQRLADHRSLLNKFETIYQTSNQHWYEPGSYASFDQYVTAILGLAQGISQNEVVEVADASALSKTLRSIISQQAIRCE